MLKVEHLTTGFHVGDNLVTAVDNVSFEINENEVLGLVGESGSGKSVTAYSIMGLLPPNGEMLEGSVMWKGKEISKHTKEEWRAIRGSQIGLIFQNPLASLNPVFTVGNQMIETIILHQKVTKVEAQDIAVDLLKKVKIPDPEKRIHQYPHEFSLGMCQRIMIAITLAMKPKLIIADEPTASLDVTIQAQILHLLEELREEYQLSVLMISHDLGVIAQQCDKIMVMYLGKIVEVGTPIEIFTAPKHPYTQALIASIPIPDPRQKQKYVPLKGDVPSPFNIPKGCSFHPRCPKVMDKCKSEKPMLKIDDKTSVSCFLYYEGNLK